MNGSLAIDKFTIILFPGLGGDERMFSRWNFSGLKKVVVNYPVPHKGESLQQYYIQLINQFPPDGPFIYCGVSLGGIIAQEVAKHHPAEKIFIVSSIKSIRERPWYYVFFKWFPLYTIVPGPLFKKLCEWLSPFFGTKTREDKELYYAMLRDMNVRFLKWGVRQVLYWKQENSSHPLTHIHGNSDHIFPIRFVTPDYIIKKGQHFMAIQRAAEICGIIEKEVDRTNDTPYT